MKAVSLRYVLFALACVLAPAAWAQDAKGTMLEKRPTKAEIAPQGAVTEADPKLEVSVFPSEKRRSISSGFYLDGAVANSTKGRIETAGITACFPQAIAEIVGSTLVNAYDPPKVVPGQNDMEEAKLATCWRLRSRHAADKGGPIDLPVGRQAFFHLDVPRVKDYFTAEQIFFRRDVYTFQIYHRYADAAGPRITREERSLEFRPPLISPLAGVLVGTLLVGLFIAIRQAVTRFSDVRTSGTFHWAALPGTVVAYAWTVLRITTSGLISGLVLVIVLNQTDAQQLPVTVSINDFWGGAFLGLMSYKLSDWLYEKFFKPA